ncbi:DUF1080 domain-containing protein [Chloroflexia bacterium SDU3-3]|nr:DUF1080 domain-containing protein [Chloroflexia bacterium SDU3-3]
MAMRSLRPAPVGQALPGQQLGWDIARAAAQSPEVQVASAAYLPGDALILYTRTSQPDRARLRTWAMVQLEPFAERFAAMPAKDQLRWVIDYGSGPSQQEVISAPLRRAAEPAQYRYTGSSPSLIGGDQTVAAAPVASAAPTAAPAATAAPSQPTAAPAQPAAPGSIPAPQALSDSAFDGAAPKANWAPLAGNWEMKDGIYSQHDNTGYDYMTMLNLDPLTHYRMDAKIRIGAGDMGGGFVYNAPSPTSRAGAQSVDFTEQGTFLRWGRYDKDGDYVYEGGADVAPGASDGGWHTLSLVTHGGQSLVSVDGKEVGTIANTSTAGYLGLTASRSMVDFDNVQVTALPKDGALITVDGQAPSAGSTQPISGTQGLSETQALDTASLGDDFADGDAKEWQTIDGTWRAADGTYQQTADGKNLGSISTFQSDQFIATVRLQHVEGNMSGGLYFGMAQRDTRSQSQVVRYAQGSQALQWGHFDEGGSFVQDGSAPLAASSGGGDGTWHTLGVRVKGGLATFTLDGEQVASDVKLTYASGYVGLYANGKVAFDDVQIAKE